MKESQLRFPARINRGFESSSVTTPEFRAFVQLFKREMNILLKQVNATDIIFDIGHFYISGFFTKDNQNWYFNTGDVRWLIGTGMLIRRTKDYSDFVGGPNQYVKYDKNFVSNLATLVG